MKITKRSFIFIIFSHLASVSPVRAYDVLIDISGNITGNTCTVSATSENIKVNMGVNTSKLFSSAGDTGPKIPFSVELEDCGTSFTGVKVMFSGDADAQNAALLKIAAGGGAGLAIQLLDGEENMLPVNTWSPLYGVSGSSNVAMNFYARYMTTELPVIAGDANAVATFLLEYP